MSSNDGNESEADISNLQEKFYKQQEKITALKELVRKSEVAHGKSTSSTKEKVKNIAERLTNLKSKARSRKTLDCINLQTTTSDEETTTLDSESTTEKEAETASTQPQLPPDASSSKETIKLHPPPVELPLTIQAPSSSSMQSVTPGAEKIQLLQQQMEENKLRMAQRASSKQHLEQLVTQLKEKFDSTQQSLEDTSELGRSMSDLSVLACASVTRERHKSATDLSSQPFNLERERIKFLENRCRLLEKQLEKEKQAHSRALKESVVSQATHKHVKELENNILELEEALSEQSMRRVGGSDELKAENERLRQDLNAKEVLISKLEARTQEQKLSPDELMSENDQLKREIEDKRTRLSELEESYEISEASRHDLALKNHAYGEQIQMLQESVRLAEIKLVDSQRMLKESEERCAALQEAKEAFEFRLEVPDLKISATQDTESQINAEMAKQIQQLQDELQQARETNSKLQEQLEENEKLEVSDAIIAEKISNLQTIVESQREDLQRRQEECSRYEEELIEKTIELNVLNANFKVLEEKLEASSRSKPLFTATAEEIGNKNPDLLAEIQQLRQKLDESNKAMIKLKLKFKQTEKQMEKLKKTTDLHAAVIQLEEEKERLQQKVIELEDEKGQWQLQQVVGMDHDFIVEKQPSPTNDVWEEKLRQQAETVRMLEEQKYEYTQKLEAAQIELDDLKKKLSHKEDAQEVIRVSAEISELQLEEQLEEQQKSVAVLKAEILRKDARILELNRRLDELLGEKQVLDKKLERYVSENMELLEKVEKLSKSSSSAESIEIVERLTQQERAEIDAFNKRLEEGEQHREDHDLPHSKDLDRTNLHRAISESSHRIQTADCATDVEANRSLLHLCDESTELMNKIELFTTERREVLEKMEHLTAENQELLKRIEDLTVEKEELETNVLLADDAKSQLELKLQELSKEKELLANQVAESSAQKAKLSQDLTSLQQSSEVVGVLEGADGSTLLDKCEKSLSKLNSELEAYRKANDKNAKFNASKKLAKEAKNAHTQLSELLHKVREASTAVETVTVVETVVAVTAPNGKALAEYEELTAQNRELKAAVEELNRELKEARERGGRESPARMVEQLPAIVNASQEQTAQKIASEKQEWEQRLKAYESECMELQDNVEDLHRQLQEARLAGEDKSVEIARLSDEVKALRKASEDLDRLINDKEMTHEKQVEQLTRFRRELEAKCETYEGEMEILHTLIAEQKQQLIESYKESEHEINLKLLDLQQRDEEISQLRTEIVQLKTKSEYPAAPDGLQQECDKLKEALKINRKLVSEQIDELANKQETIDTLNQQIIELYRSMEDNANKLIEKEDEIVCLQDTLDSNNKLLGTLQRDNDEQKAVVDKLLAELHSNRTSVQQLLQLEAEVKRLTGERKELLATNENIEQRNREQLEKLKKYAANLKKRALQCQEYETKIKELEKGSLEAFATKESELRSAIQEKSDMLREAVERSEHLEKDLKAAQGSLQQRAEEVEDLRSALAAVQLQLDGRREESPRNEERLLHELAAKTASLQSAEQALIEVQDELMRMQGVEKDRLSADKKLEAQLQQQTQLITELRAQITSADRTEEAIKELEQRLHSVTEELKLKSLKFEKSKAVIKERNSQIQRLHAEIKDLQSKLSVQPEEEAQLESAGAESHTTQVAMEVYTKLQSEYDNLNGLYQSERSNFEQTIARLETLHDGIQAKLLEDSAYIESLEQENAKYKEKICKLEECVGTFEERRSSMERRAFLLDAQMQTRVNEYEKSEDVLIARLNALAEHDDYIEKRLLTAEEEKENLQTRLHELHGDFIELEDQHSQLKRENQAFRAEIASTLEAENASLREKLAAVEPEMQRMRSLYDNKLAVKATEIDELECELSDQLEQLHAEKRTLTEELEQSRDQCAAQMDEIVRLKESLNALEQARGELERESSWLRLSQESAQQDQYELQELRMQSMQDKSEIDHLRHQIETLAANHEIELQGLRTQISELDTLRMQVGQNQTDDQVFIETENKRLTDLLVEKETQIENYQRQNLQLQMAAAAASAAPTQQQAQTTDGFFMTFGAPSYTALPGTADPEDHDLERDREAAEVVARLQRDLTTLQAELHAVQEGNNELKRQLADKQRELDGMRVQQQHQPRPSHASSDVIPAPAFFASSEQQLPSPFDDLVPQTRAVNSLTLEVGALPSTTHEQPTIEDLQRNVSDLEKHAQDLEQKLVLRNQRDGEVEERMRELQQRLNAAEAIAQERDQQLQSLRESEERERQQLTELQSKLEAAELQIQEREAALKHLEQQRAGALTLEDENERQVQNKSSERLSKLQIEVEQLQRSLKDRDAQLQQLRHMISEAIQRKARAADIESQIIPESIDIDAALAAAASTLDTLFGDSGAPDFQKLIAPQESGEPVVEELIVPKKVHLLGPQETLELMDDWGESWDGGQEALVEAARFSSPQQPISLITREQKLEIQLQEQQERIEELENRQQLCEQQKQELQQKTAKLMKKLKEYKVKIDELQSLNAAGFRKSSSVESNAAAFADLDAAIQEELKGQVKHLEDKLEEQRRQQENLTTEKEKLLKRVDMLTAGNERMSEMKERQDMEVQMYQSRIRELQQKLSKLEEWGGETAAPVRASETPVAAAASDQQTVEMMTQKVAALQAELKDANDERQELQALLDEEKANCTRSEGTARRLQTLIDSQQHADTSKYNELKFEHQNLQERFHQMQDENARLTHDLLASKTELEARSRESKATQELESRLLEFQKKNEQIQKELSDTQLLLLELRTRNEELTQRNRELLETQSICSELEQKVAVLVNENEQLQSAVRRLESEAASLQSSAGVKTQADASTSLGVDELSAQLQEKDSEIAHLKQRVEDLMREDQTEKLVLEILAKNQEIHMLKIKVRHLEEELEHQVTHSEPRRDKPATCDAATEAIHDASLSALQKRVAELEDDKRNMEGELEVLNTHVLNSLQLEDKMKATVLTLDAKNIEIAELRKSLEKQQMNADARQPDTPAVDFVTLNAQWEAHVEQKCSEIAQLWRDHLEQREKDFRASESRLQEEILRLQAAASQQQQEKTRQVTVSETTATSSASDESTPASGSSSVAPSKAGTPLRRLARNTDTTEEGDADADAIIERMQAALESQEIEIVTLKEQLAIRSAEYARLAAQYDPFKLQTTLSHSGVTTTAGASSAAAEPIAAKRYAAGTAADTGASVPKSELDLAMYMLHQRDMRCEELTLELVSLLEERDTLQLKLSNTLRQVEAMKAQSSVEPPRPTREAAEARASPSSASSESAAGTTASEASDELSQKLSQLQSVNHSKDKVIKEERDQRIRQMEQIQQDVAKMPSEALSELLGSGLSQTGQSPSSALLNWLWGSKTPTSGGVSSS